MDRFVDKLLEGFESDYQKKTKSIYREPQLFLENFYNIRSTMTYSQTRDSLLIFLMGGFDTTGKAIPSVLLLLAMHSKIQEKVFEELNSIITREGDDLIEDSLSKMKYLEMVIKEALRLIPVALLFGRTVKKDIRLSKNL